MSLSALKEELHRKTASEVARLEKEGEEEAKRIREQAHEEAKAILHDAREEAVAFASKEQTQVSAAKLKAKRLVQDARFQLVEEAVEELKERLADRVNKKGEYQKLLEKLIRQGLQEAGGKGKLLVRKEDVPFAKKFGSVGPPIDTLGGVVVVSADGGVKISNTFEALLEEKGEVFRQKAFELLFKGE